MKLKETLRAIIREEITKLVSEDKQEEKQIVDAILQNTSKMSLSLVKSTLERLPAWKAVNASIGLQPGFHDNPNIMEKPVSAKKMAEARDIRQTKVPVNWYNTRTGININDKRLPSHTYVYRVTLKWEADSAGYDNVIYADEKLTPQIEKAFDKLGYMVFNDRNMPMEPRPNLKTKKIKGKVYPCFSIYIRPKYFSTISNVTKSPDDKRAEKAYVKANT